MEKEQPHNIAHQPQSSHNDDDLRVADLGRGDDPSKRLKSDTNAKCNKEDTVDERAQDLGSLPAVGVFR